MPPPRPDPKVVVVTGASAGVGRATALAFAASGAAVGLMARGAARLEEAAREVESRGGRALVLPADVAEAEAVFGAAARVEAELGPIDVWVNNAMATVFSPVGKLTPEEFRRATDVTYHGAVHGTMAALRHMAPRNRGAIVQVGSALAYRAIPLQAAYCGAKHALRGFTDALRCELIHDRSDIRLTMVHLPALNTPQFDWSRNHVGRKPQPLAPIFQPELAADAIVWAASQDEREVWVGTPTAKAIVGNRVAPWLLDRVLASKAYEGQITSEPDPPGRPDNLFQPVEGAFGAHGRFDGEARSDRWAESLTMKLRSLLRR